MAKRQTADEVTIHLWSDGSITYNLGFYLPGIGASRSPEGQARDLTAGWLVMAEAALYDREELPALIRAARKAVAAGKPTRVEMLRRFQH